MCAAPTRRSSRCDCWQSHGLETQRPLSDFTRIRPMPSQMGQVVIACIRLAQFGGGALRWERRGGSWKRVLSGFELIVLLVPTLAPQECGTQDSFKLPIVVSQVPDGGDLGHPAVRLKVR